MTPAVRSWLLEKAKDELREARTEEKEGVRWERHYAVRAAEEPSIWRSELRRAKQSLAADRSRVKSLERVVRDLSEKP